MLWTQKCTSKTESGERFYLFMYATKGQPPLQIGCHATVASCIVVTKDICKIDVCNANQSREEIIKHATIFGQDFYRPAAYELINDHFGKPDDYFF